MPSHNSGANKHTAKCRPWKLICYIAFDTREKAAAFEKYLKAGSGHAFAKRHLW
jgi:predicted GIY-YIG superfamily endonuclease